MNNKLIALLLVILFSVGIMIPVSADGSESLPEGTPSQHLFYTDEFTVVGDDDASYIINEALLVTSNYTGMVNISLSFDTTVTMKKLGFTTLSLQHWNGSSWDDVWTKTDQYLQNTDSFSYSKLLSSLTSNDYYRVSVELYAKKGFLQTQRKTIVSNYILCK